MRNNDQYISPRTNAPDADNRTSMQDEPMTVTYPEIYYILQPHVLMECDNMEVSGAMPTQDRLDRMCDRVYGNACRTHPELVQYDMENDRMAGASAVPNPPRRYPDGYPNNYPDGYRRHDNRPGRGFDINDVIRILLLNEIFNRRRRRYY